MFIEVRFVVTVRKIECVVDEIRTYCFSIIFQVDSLGLSSNNIHPF